MPVSVSIRNIPDDVAERLKARAARNHRSLQGELLFILEQAAREEAAVRDPLDILEEVRAWGVESPDEATEIVREARDQSSRCR